MKKHPALHTITASLAVACALALAGTAVAADPGHMTVSVDKPGAKIGPLFYGLMTEEINYSYDGGLYAELIQNRIMRNPIPNAGRGGGRGNRGGAAASAPATAPAAAPAPEPAAAPAAPTSAPLVPHWSAVTKGGAAASIAPDPTDPINTTALTTSLKLTITDVGTGGRAGVANDGFWGIPAKPNTTYKASFYAKAGDGFTGPLTVAIESDDGNTTAASTTIPAITNQWKKYEVTLKTGQLTPSVTNKFVISGASKGTVNFNLVSLFPPTYKDRPNGFRVDLMEKLAGLKPAFLRFPGGNYVEGSNFENRYNWRITVGPYEERPGHMSPWGYRSSDGMGLLEFLYWCEDLHMEPVLAVFAGLNLNGGRGVLTGDALKPSVQDALDEIEYVSGDASTKYGAMPAAKDGHPEPFKLTYVEIGNEDWLNNGTPTYNERFTQFYDAIKAKYPKLQIISTMRPSDKLAMDRRPDVLDDHTYSSPQAMLTNDHNRHTSYDRSGPKLFMGEWATQGSQPTGNFLCALGDASFLSGLENNADVVLMECYAPLFVNVNPGGIQWRNPNMIGYDALGSFASPPWYTQKMYVDYRGDTVLPLQITPQIAENPPAPAGEAPATPPPAPAGGGGGRRGNRGPQPIPGALVGSASRVDANGDIILKIVNSYRIPQTEEITLQGVTTVDKTATGEQFTGNPTDMNSMEEPTKTAPPKPFTITDAAPKFTHEFPANSVTVMRLKTK